MYGFNYPQAFQSYQQNTQPIDERLWVANEQAAEAYLVAPNSFVRLWDAGKPVFYEKRTDASGRPLPLEAYEYARRAPKEPVLSAVGTIDYKSELDAIKGRLAALEKGANYAESNVDDTAV